MKQFTFTLIALAFITSATSGQDHFCGTVEAERELKQLYPELGTDEDFENWLAPKVAEFNNNKHLKSGMLSTLPIIFHVIHKGESVGVGDNISKRVIDNQISQLNLDFTNRAGSTVAIAADLQINFCAATISPDGSYLDEPGVNRISRSSIGLSTTSPFDKSIIQSMIKPMTQWDPNQYINVWIVPMTGGRVGYAQFPNHPLPGLDGSLPANTDGIVMIPTAIGSVAVPNRSGSQFEQVISHEMGHFLGLRHIWGDAPPGSSMITRCTLDDFVNDTPRTAFSNRVCAANNQCNDILFGNPTDPFDMIPNYMDYTAPCFSTFTPGQNARVQIIINNAPRRKELLNSTVCSPPPTTSFPDVFPCALTPFINYPNIGTVFDVCNGSALPIPPSFIGFYLSPVLPDPIPLHFLDEIQMPAINPQGSIVGFQWGLDLSQFPDIPAGDYLLMAVADHQNEFAESDEENNTMVSLATINILGNGCDDIEEINCGEINTFFHNKILYKNNWEDYPCTQFIENGAERLFSFTTTQTGDVSISLSNINSDVGRSWVYLLQYCNPSVCLGNGDNFTTTNLPAGTYYLAIEEYSGSDSGFILEVNCNTNPIPCQSDITLGCNQWLNFNMSNYTENRVDNYNCVDLPISDSDISSTFAGPEVIHSLFLEVQSDIVITLYGDDMTAILVDDCNQANCIAYTQDGESIFYPQLPEGGYLIIVEQGNPNNNDYQLYVDCNYPNSGYCPEILNLYHGPIPSGTYAANNSINGNTTVVPNSNITIHAGIEINFQPNYESHQVSSVINAYIEGCPQLPSVRINRSND